MVTDFYKTKSYENNRIENLQEVWEKISQEKIWKEARRFYSLESKDVLLKTMQLYSADYKPQGFVSPFGENFCDPILQHLRQHGEFRCSPFGRELEKQRCKQSENALSFLSHEVALAAGRFEAAIAKFESWHRKKSIEGFGNAIVPQVALNIFLGINDASKAE